MPISSSMRWPLGAIALVCAISVALGSARAEAVVAAGHSVTLMTLSSVDQLCHSLGTATVSVIEPPRGGFLEVVQTRAYPNFNALNTRSRCNTLKLPATQVVYQSAGTFLGTDWATIEVIFPGGNARRIRVPVSVRPVAPNVPLAAPSRAELSPQPKATSRSRKATGHEQQTAEAASRRRRCTLHCEVPGGKAAHGPPTAKTPLVNI